jgi:hypothetical protein
MSTTVLDPLAARVARRHLALERNVDRSGAPDAIAQVDVTVREAIAVVQVATTGSVSISVNRRRLRGGACKPRVPQGKGFWTIQ